MIIYKKNDSLIVILYRLKDRLIMNTYRERSFSFERKSFNNSDYVYIGSYLSLIIYRNNDSHIINLDGVKDRHNE